MTERNQEKQNRNDQALLSLQNALDRMAGDVPDMPDIFRKGWREAVRREAAADRTVHPRTEQVPDAGSSSGSGKVLPWRRILSYAAVFLFLLGSALLGQDAVRLTKPRVPSVPAPATESAAGAVSRESPEAADTAGAVSGDSPAEAAREAEAPSVPLSDAPLMLYAAETAGEEYEMAAEAAVEEYELAAGAADMEYEMAAEAADTKYDTAAGAADMEYVSADHALPEADTAAESAPLAPSEPKARAKNAAYEAGSASEAAPRTASPTAASSPEPAAAEAPGRTESPAGNLFTSVSAGKEAAEKTEEAFAEAEEEPGEAAEEAEEAAEEAEEPSSKAEKADMEAAAEAEEAASHPLRIPGIILMALALLLALLLFLSRRRG